ncbi:MAG TPA: glycosyltransferase family 4 protein [Rhizomicrobium sp.]|jgi:glycosyltransferase involved in cell wall biosynthesis
MKLPDIPLAESAPEKFVSLHEAALARGDGREPIILICWPDARMNKYQALLYGAAFEQGFEVVRITKLEQINKVWWPGHIVFHAHWFSGIYATCASEEDAIAANAAAQETLLNFQARTGARFLWTAHNLLPHGTPFPEATLAMRRWIVERFDAIHLLNQEHRGVLEDAFGMPLRRTFVAPHPFYTDVYPDYVRRDEARSAFGLRHDGVVFLAFGSLQTYKKLDVLLDAFAKVSAQRSNPPSLLIAGKPVDATVIGMLRDAASYNPDIKLSAGTVPDEDVQYYVRAADAMVLTQSEALNSGSALLAVTMGLPVIAPDTPAFRPLRPLGVQTYDPPDAAALADAMAAFLDRRPSAANGKNNLYTDYLPQAVSTRFFSSVRELVTGDA